MAADEKRLSQAWHSLHTHGRREEISLEIQ